MYNTDTTKIGNFNCKSNTRGFVRIDSVTLINIIYVVVCIALVTLPEMCGMQSPSAHKLEMLGMTMMVAPILFVRRRSKS